MTRRARTSYQSHISTLAAALCLTLAACGGGGGGSSSSTDTSSGGSSSSSSSGSSSGSSSSSSSGSSSGSSKVVAFAAGADPRYQIGSTLMTNVGALTTETQGSDGGFSTLGSASTAAAVSDISGNADYAIGRWADGKHYAVFNNADGVTLPVGNLTCDAGVFTHPTLYGNSNTTGSATGTATLAFTDTVTADIGLTINVTGAASTGTGTLSVTMEKPGGMLVKGFNGGPAIIGSGNNSQAQMYLAVGSQGTYLLATYYQLELSDASYYTGVAMFTCK